MTWHGPPFEPGSFFIPPEAVNGYEYTANNGEGIAVGCLSFPLFAEEATASAAAQSHQQVETASMLITAPSLSMLKTGWNAQFSKGAEGFKPRFRDIAMVTKSDTAETAYGWLGQFPVVREWIGERRIKTISTYGFTIKNRLFEETIEVKRTDIEDDNIGVLDPLFQELGRAASEQPDLLVFEMLSKGFTNPCYDNQNFFDLNHPSTDKFGNEIMVSNYQNAGGGPPWFLLDTSRAIRPIVYQERTDYELHAMTNPENEHVFLTDRFLYGVRGRSAAGYGLWQLAAASTAALTAANFEMLLTGMQNLRGEGGRLLGVQPTLLVVPPSLRVAALRLLKQQNLAGGESNIYFEYLDYLATAFVGA